MKVYAEATKTYGEFKKGDQGEVINEYENGSFEFMHNGDERHAVWKTSILLNGASWKRIEINEGDDTMPVKLESGCYTKIDHLSVEDQKRIGQAYIDSGATVRELFETLDKLISKYHEESLSSQERFYLSYYEGWLCFLSQRELDRFLGFSAKHIPAEDILNSLQHAENSVSQNSLSLLTQIKQAKIAYDEAEEHLQSLLNKGHEELGDCGISFEIR